MKLYNKLRKEKGATALVSIFVALLFVFFIALVADAGLLYYKEAKLQNAVDASVVATSHHLGASTESMVDYAKQYLKENGFDYTKYGDKMSVNIDQKAIAGEDTTEDEYISEGYIKLSVSVDDAGLLGVFSGLQSVNLKADGYAKCDVEYGTPDTLKYSIIASDTRPALSATGADSAISLESSDNDINSYIRVEGNVHSNSDIYIKSQSIDSSKLTEAIYNGCTCDSYCDKDDPIRQNCEVCKKDYLNCQGDKTEIYNPAVYSAVKNIYFNSYNNINSSVSVDDQRSIKLRKAVFNILNNINFDSITETVPLRSAYESKANEYLENTGFSDTEKAIVLAQKNNLYVTGMENNTIQCMLTGQNFYIYNVKNQMAKDLMAEIAPNDTNYMSKFNDALPDALGEFVFSGITNVSADTVNNPAFNTNVKFEKLTQEDTEKKSMNLTVVNTIINVKIADKTNNSNFEGTYRFALAKSFVKNSRVIDLPNMKPYFVREINRSIKNATTSKTTSGYTQTEGAETVKEAVSNARNDLDEMFNINENGSNFNSQSFFINSIQKRYGKNSDFVKHVMANSAQLKTPSSYITKYLDANRYNIGSDAVDTFRKTVVNQRFGNETEAAKSSNNNAYIEAKKTEFQNTKGYNAKKTEVEQRKFNDSNSSVAEAPDEKEAFLSPGTDLSVWNSIPAQKLNEKLSVDASTWPKTVTPYPSQESVKISQPTVNETVPDVNMGNVGFVVTKSAGSTATKSYNILNVLNGTQNIKTMIDEVEAQYYSFFPNKWSDGSSTGNINELKMKNGYTYFENANGSSGSWTGNYRRPNNPKHITGEYFYQDGRGLYLYPTIDSDGGKELVRVDKYIYSSRYEIILTQGTALFAKGNSTVSGLRCSNDVLYTPWALQFKSITSDSYASNQSAQTNVIVNGNAEVGRIDVLKGTYNTNAVIVVKGDLYIDKLSGPSNPYLNVDNGCSLTLIVSGALKTYEGSNQYTGDLTIPSNVKIYAGAIYNNLQINDGAQVYVKDFATSSAPKGINISGNGKFSCWGDGTFYFKNSINSLTIGESQTIQFNNVVAPGITFTNNGKILVKGNWTSGTFNNNGTVYASGNDSEIKINTELNNKGIMNLGSNRCFVYGTFTQGNLPNHMFRAAHLNVTQNMIVNNGPVLINTCKTNGDGYNDPRDTYSQESYNYYLSVGNSLSLYNDAVVFACGDKGEKTRTKIYVKNDLLMYDRSRLFVYDKLEVYGNIKLNTNSAFASSAAIFAYKGLIQGNDIYNIDGSEVTKPWISFTESRLSNFIIGAGTKFRIDKSNYQDIESRHIINYGTIYIDNDGFSLFRCKYIENHGTIICKNNIELTSSANNGTRYLDSSIYSDGEIYVSGNITAKRAIYLSKSQFYVKGDIAIEGASSSAGNYNSFVVEGNSNTYISGWINSNYNHKIILDNNMSGVFSVYGYNHATSLNNVNYFENLSSSAIIYLGTGSGWSTFQDSRKVTIGNLTHRGRMFVYGNLTITGNANLYGDDGRLSTDEYCGKLITAFNLTINGDLIVNRSGSGSPYGWYKQRFVVKAYRDAEIKGTNKLYGKAELYGVKSLVLGSTWSSNVTVGVADDGLAYFGPDSPIPNNLYIDVDGATNKDYFKGQVYIKGTKSSSMNLGFVNTSSSSDINFINGARFVCDGDVSVNRAHTTLKDNSILYIGGMSSFYDRKIHNQKGELYLIGRINIYDAEHLEFNSGCTNFIGPVNSDSAGSLTKNWWSLSGNNYFYRNSITSNGWTDKVLAYKRFVGIYVDDGETYVSNDVSITYMGIALKLDDKTTLHCSNLNLKSGILNNGYLIIRNRLNYLMEDGKFALGTSLNVSSNNRSDHRYDYGIANGDERSSSNPKDAIMFIGNKSDKYALSMYSALKNNGSLYVASGMESYGAHIIEPDEIVIRALPGQINPNHTWTTRDTYDTEKKMAPHFSIVTGEGSNTHFGGDVKLYAGVWTGVNSSFSCSGDCKYGMAILNGGKFFIKNELKYNNVPSENPQVAYDGSYTPEYQKDFFKQVYHIETFWDYDNKGSFSIINGFVSDGSTGNRNAEFYVGGCKNPNDEKYVLKLGTNSSDSVKENKAGTIQNWGKMYINGSIDSCSRYDTALNMISLSNQKDAELYTNGYVRLYDSALISFGGSKFACSGECKVDRVVRIAADENLCNDDVRNDNPTYFYVGGDFISSNNATSADDGNVGLPHSWWVDGFDRGLGSANYFMVYDRSNIYVGGNQFLSKSHNKISNDCTLTVNGTLNSPGYIDIRKGLNLFTLKDFTSDGSINIDDGAYAFVGGHMLAKTGKIWFGRNNTDDIYFDIHSACICGDEKCVEPPEDVDPADIGLYVNIDCKVCYDKSTGTAHLDDCIGTLSCSCDTRCKNGVRNNDCDICKDYPGDCKGAILPDSNPFDPDAVVPQNQINSSNETGGVFYVAGAILSGYGEVQEFGFTKVVCGKFISCATRLTLDPNSDLWMLPELYGYPYDQVTGSDLALITIQLMHNNSFFRITPVDGSVYVNGGLTLNTNSSVLGTQNLYVKGAAVLQPDSLIYMGNNVNINEAYGPETKGFDSNGAVYTTLICKSLTNKHPVNYKMYINDYDSTKSYKCARCGATITKANIKKNVVCPVTLYANNSVSVRGTMDMKSTYIVTNQGGVNLNNTLINALDNEKNVTDLPNAIASYNGDVTYLANESTMCALLYAPAGTVTFTGNKQYVSGSVLSKRVVMNSRTMHFRKFGNWNTMRLNLPKSGRVYLISKTEYDDKEENVDKKYLNTTSTEDEIKGGAHLFFSNLDD